MVRSEGAFGAAWFAEAGGGRLASGADTGLDRVETDSRNAGPGALFVALPGERVDGHDYVEAAARAGTGAALVSAAWWRARGSGVLASLAASGVAPAVIVADDPLLALRKAAAAWRARFPSLLRFGVTGSSGKTSAKEILASLVGAAYRTVKTPGNLNSHIGLPASLFLIRPEHEAAVFEMGINFPGEMDMLTEAYEPDCALITNVGSAHIGVLGGSRQDIAREKKRITARFTGSQRLVVWEDDDFRDFLLAGVRGEAYTFGPRSLDGFEGARDLGLDGWSLRYCGVESRLRLPGAHNLLNALGAIRAASLYGVGPEAVARGLEAVEPLEGRTNIVRGDYTVVDDCYNANVESTLAAMAFCDSAAVRGRRLYVLGSMKELGAESEAAHRRVGAAAAASRADELFFFGEEAAAACEAALRADPGRRASHFVDYAALEAAVSSAAGAGDLVLVKASRSMALDRLSAKLTGKGKPHVS